jgi:hypothetical protein
MPHCPGAVDGRRRRSCKAESVVICAVALMGDPSARFITGTLLYLGKVVGAALLAARNES